MSRRRESTAMGSADRPAAAQGPSFGHYLQTVRTQNLISLEQVAEETRISLTTLRAIEQEDFARLPPDVFAIGFIKAYAQAVGADGSEAVQRFHAQRGLQEHTLKAWQPPESGRRDIFKKLVLALAALAVLVAVCLFVYRQWQQNSTPDLPALSSRPADETASPPAERLATQPPSEASKRIPLPPSPRHQLTIVAHENSWIKVVIDQGAALEHKLKAGDQLRLEAQTGFNLLIGNVGGVKLSLNNQPVTVPGKRGEVVNIHLP